jgi:ATP-binding cassette subfamily F protein uup
MVMDEPTNDLDSDTLELLEEMLMEYAGTVLLVSHDREFLNNIVTSTIVFEGAGRLVEYVGGYDDWLRQRTLAVPPRTEKTAKTEKPRPRRDRPRVLTFRENKEIEALPARIEALEAERDALYKSLSDPDLYRLEGSRIPAIKMRIEEVEKEIAIAYERWEFLEAIPTGLC